MGLEFGDRASLWFRPATPWHYGPHPPGSTTRVRWEAYAGRPFVWGSNRGGVDWMESVQFNATGAC